MGEGFLGGRGSSMQRLKGRNAPETCREQGVKILAAALLSCFPGLSQLLTLSLLIGQDGKPSLGGAGLGLGTLDRPVDSSCCLPLTTQDLQASLAGTRKLCAPWP